MTVLLALQLYVQPMNLSPDSWRIELDGQQRDAMKGLSVRADKITLMRRNLI